jgi:uncharacterized FlgJ-related protein
MIGIKESLLCGLILVFLGCESNTQLKEKNVSREFSVFELPILSVVDETHLPKRTVYTSTIKDIFDLFDTIGYSKLWNEGLDVIPRVYLQRISCRWKTQSSKIPVKIKKDIFFKLITPEILRANELIQLDRNRLLELVQHPIDLEDENYEWLQEQVKKYKLVKKKEEIIISDELLERLIVRMDTIPPSLALAQAAEESGWATSRFAVEGNALFGQWTFSEDSMIPQEQRSELGNYGLARFKTPQDSVNSYMLNLNTHNAYKKLRSKRFKLRKQGKKVTGLALSETLDKYSERGYAYVEGLKKMIAYNKLAHFDNAYLASDEVINIMPRSIRKKREVIPNDLNQSDQNASRPKVPLQSLDKAAP